MISTLFREGREGCKKRKLEDGQEVPKFFFRKIFDIS